MTGMLVCSVWYLKQAFKSNLTHDDIERLWTIRQLDDETTRRRVPSLSSYA
jgi:hypothetical protein